MKNLILCGFMGSGKTTVGRILARQLGMQFVDMDAWIEESQGMNIPDIFAKSGEEGFRALERDACRSLAQNSGQVIAAGGGALTFEVNAQVLRETGIIVFLDVTPETVIERIAQDESRPLLAGSPREKEERVRVLLEERRPLYEKAADVRVDARMPPMQTAQAVLHACSDAL